MPGHLARAQMRAVAAATMGAVLEWLGPVIQARLAAARAPSLRMDILDANAASRA